MGSPLQHIAHPQGRGFSSAVGVPLGSSMLVFISGEIGRDAEGKMVNSSFEAEARQCFANIKTALERAGATFNNVVRITAYIKDLADYAVFAQVRSEFFGSNWPASTAVGVNDLLFGARLEVDAVAVVATATA